MKKKGETIIQLKEVWKTYVMGEVQIHALRGLNIDIKKGEFVSILGPSGSGKSTAMALVGCLDTPTKGAVFLGGKDISKMTESDLAQVRGKKIGFVFQQFHLMSTLSALKNVMLPTIFQGIPQEERLEKAKSLLEMVDLGDRMHHKPSEMSGGQMQRVAIARALVNDPEVILADEPTGNLDSQTGKQIVEILKGLHKKGKTVVMVTHDRDLGKLAQRTISLKDGRCCKKGD